MEMIFNVLDGLENIEKEYGALGTIFGLLLIAVTTIFVLAGIVALVWLEFSVVNWVIHQLWWK